MKLLGNKVNNIISIHGGNYTIQMPNPDSIITMSSVSLDSPENWTQNNWYNVVTYNLTPGMEYTAMDFSVQPDIDMDNSDVFDAIMSVQAAGLFNIPLNIQQSSLPVRLISFEAKSNGDNVDCFWKTEREVNNHGFNIERSPSGHNFETIGWVDATSEPTPAYSFVDKIPMTGKNYYRLKQVDLDGTPWYSDVVLVSIKSNNKQITLYPNPVSDILYINGIKEERNVSIYSLNGQIIKSFQYRDVGINIQDLNQGVYYLMHFDGDDMKTEKFIVN